MSVVAMPPYPSTIPASAFSPTLATHQAARTPITADMFKRVRWVVEGVRRRLLVRVDDTSDRT
jgi:hypothetical protein